MSLRPGTARAVAHVSPPPVAGPPRTAAPGGVAPSDPQLPGVRVAYQASLLQRPVVAPSRPSSALAGFALSDVVGGHRGRLLAVAGPAGALAVRLLDWQAAGGGDGGGEQ